MAYDPIPQVKVGLKGSTTTAPPDLSGHGSTSLGDLGRQTTPLDYRAEQMNWTQSTPATNAHTSMLGLAGRLQNNSNAANNNLVYQRNGIYNKWGDYGGLNGALQTMYQGPNALQNGPQNAWGQAQMQNFRTQALNTLGQNNRQTMAGYANANAGRGVAGNSLGGIMSQQNAVQNAGAVANSGWEAQQAGQALGLNQYNARAGVASQLGNAMGEQDQRDYSAYNNEYQSRQQQMKNSFDNYQRAQNALTDWDKTYGIQMSSTSGGAQGDQVKMYLRAQRDNLVREMNLSHADYLKYGAQSNPNQATTMWNRNV